MASEPGLVSTRAAPDSPASELLTRRLIVFTLCSIIIGIVMTNLVMSVPVAIPTHTGDEARRYWEVAAVAAAIVFGAALFVAAFTARRLWLSGGVRAEYVSPPPLRFAVAPAEMVWTCAATSFALFLIAIYAELPDWITALAILVPMLPVLALEGVHRWRLDGFYALFLGVSLLQAGHLGEHSAQVLQLVIHDGNLDKSHGVFGQFDFETVHFWWDTAIWFVTAALLLRYWGNGWVWVSFAFASMHQLEHSYLYYVFLTDFDYYMAGGLAGIMGKGGIIGSPFARPYLHFFYNFLVTVPMLIGLWSQQQQQPDGQPVSDAER